MTLADQVPTLGTLLAARAARSGATECWRVKAQDRWVPTSWRAFHDEVRAVAAALIDAGLGRGSAVAILGEARPEWCIADMAAIAIGAMSVGICQTRLVDQLRYILTGSRARALYVHGDQRPYLVALVTPDEREATRVAGELGITPAARATHAGTAERVSAAADAANQKLAPYERIKRHAILHADFSIAEGTLTPTLKVKRKAVADRCRAEIEALYA